MLSLRYETSGKLNETMAQSHISFEMYTEVPIQQLHIRFAYTDALLTDVEKVEQYLTQSLERDFAPEIRERYKELHQSGQMKVESIRNLITLSVEDANGFRGASHRGGDADLRIGVENVSPGYVAGEFPPGKIVVTISLHCLVVPCNYTLEIDEERDA